MTYEVELKLHVEAGSQAEALAELETRLRTRLVPDTELPEGRAVTYTRSSSDPYGVRLLETSVKTKSWKP